MNSLSWMIYLAGVVGNIGCIAGALLIPSGLAVGVAGIVWGVHSNEYEKKERESAARILKVATRIFVACAVVGIVLPDSKTVYAIAASEYGEEALKTPEVSKARAALNAWLDKQIAPEKAP